MGKFRRFAAARSLALSLSATGFWAIGFWATGPCGMGFARAYAQAPESPDPGTAAEPSGGQASDALKTATDEVQRLTAPVFIDGKGPFQFIIDTASNQSIISRELATALSLPAGPSATVQNAGGVDVEPTAVIARLDVGSRRLRNVSAPMLAQTDIGAQGMIGLDVLHDQRIVMDFKQKRLTVETSRASPSEPRAIVVYGQRRFGQLVLVDAAWGGRPIFVVLDSGAYDTVGNAAFRKLAATRDPGLGVFRTTNLISVTGRVIPAELSVLPEIRIGGVRVHNLTLAYSNLHTFETFDLADAPALLLGVDVMHLFERVSVDFRRKEVRFVLPQGSSGPEILSP